MAVILNKLYAQGQRMDLRLIAGGEGLNQMVSWVHMVENKEASSFLDGGELVFTTGIGLFQGSTLMDLVKSTYGHHAAGLIINIGPYIQAVDEDIILFGNDHCFPIFTVPWRIHLSEIIRQFSYMITKSDQYDQETAAAFLNAIFFPKQEEMYVVSLTRRGFQAEWAYSVVFIQVEGKKDGPTERLNEINNLLKAFLMHYYEKFMIFTHEGRLLLVLADYSETETHAIVESAMQYLGKILKPEEVLSYGVGKNTRSIRCLYKSYHQASSLQKLQAHGKVDRSLHYYSELGLYKLLLAIEDPDILEDYYEKTILPLINYDQEHGTSLYAFLQCYLETDCNAKVTAEKLYIHRNSVTYNIHKIESILHISLSSLNVKMQLFMGMLIRDFL